MSQFQVELGNVATPFEHRSYGEELALCQRYYSKSYESSVNPGSTTYKGAEGYTGSLGGATTTYIVQIVKFPVKMRTTASVVAYDTVGNQGKCTRELPGTGTYTNQSVTFNNASESGAHAISVSGNNAAYFYVHYTADAEL